MEYSKLVEVYEELNKTTKRLEKTHIISEFLEDISIDDAEHVMLLLEGRVFPNYDSREIGIAARTMLKSLSAATGISADKIENEWKKQGDLGLVAEIIVKAKKQSTLNSTKLTVKKVFENIRKLAELQGEGTVERKVQLIAELMTSAKPLESRYIVKTILDEMRIGVGEGVMRDAIIWSSFGKEIGIKYSREENDIGVEDREKYSKYADAVQRAYDLTNEFAEVAKAAKKGLAALENIEMKVCIPIQVMLALKTGTIEEAFETVGRPCAVEFKYDGFRCIAGHTPIYTNWKGLISIKDIKVGDKVLTHNGNLRKVTAIHKRTIDRDEKLYKVQSYLGNEFRITEKHPLLIFNNKLQWMPIEKLKKSDEMAFPIPKIKAKSVLGKKLELKDESGYKKLIPVNKFFFRFLGYWIGDGFTNEFHNTERVGIIFNNKKDRKLCRFYKENIMKNFQLGNLSENIHNGAVYLYWRDKPLRIYLSKFFRREWKGKMLPEWFYGISKSQFDEFLKGWIESDGYKDELGRVSITTKERDLAMFAQLLGLQFKKIIGVKKIRIHNKTYYRLIIPKSERKTRIVKNYLLVKILKLEEVLRPDPRTVLYNIQVEKDESYCTAMAALHNCQIHKKEDNEIKIFTRRLENVTRQFPDVAEFVKKNVKGKSFIIDSEAVGYDRKTGKYLPFQSISQRIKRKYDIERISEEFPVELNVFDLIYCDGKNMISEPFGKRRKILDKMINQERKKIVLSKQKIVSEKKDVEKFFKEAVNAGNEGLMFKSLNAPYKPGARVGYMIKFKRIMETLDLVIVGAEWGEGKRSKWLSSYEIACIDENKNFAEVGRASTGLKEKEEEGLSFLEMTRLLKPLIISEKGKEVKVKPKIVIEVGYEEIQKSPSYSSGFALRFPRIISLRIDKGPKEASALDYVNKLYDGQKKR